MEGHTWYCDKSLNLFLTSGCKWDSANKYFPTKLQNLYLVVSIFPINLFLPIFSYISYYAINAFFICTNLEFYQKLQNVSTNK